MLKCQLVVKTDLFSSDILLLVVTNHGQNPLVFSHPGMLGGRGAVEAFPGHWSRRREVRNTQRGSQKAERLLPEDDPGSQHISRLEMSARSRSHVTTNAVYGRC